MTHRFLSIEWWILFSNRLIEYRYMYTHLSIDFIDEKHCFTTIHSDTHINEENDNCNEKRTDV